MNSFFHCFYILILFGSASLVRFRFWALGYIENFTGTGSATRTYLTVQCYGAAPTLAPATATYLKLRQGRKNGKFII